jgi:hypothetical protein
MRLPFELIVALGVGFAVIVLVVAWLGRVASTPKGETGFAPQYESLSCFLTPAERSFFGVLQRAVASDYIIFAKVRLADIIRPVKNPSRNGWQTAFNRISSKHVDFILCDPARVSVLLAIELDDRSHATFDQGMRDLPKNCALKDSGIPLFRVPARHSYSPIQLRADIDALLAPMHPQPARATATASNSNA